MTYLRFDVLNPGDEVGVPSSARLYGPDVAADGSIALQQGQNYTFYYEQTMPYGYRPTYGFNAKTQIGYYTLTGSADYSSGRNDTST
ncbi:MAG: hypothetical protein IJZ85_05805 [Lachnospiraceae bacterium]|nr:hypothetical protein [Lachnospiraceae bacterium]